MAENFPGTSIQRCFVLPSAGEAEASRASGLKELPHSHTLRGLPRRPQFVTLWKYLYMLHAEKITACALLELGHMKEPGRAPQWVPEKGRGPRLVSCTESSRLQAETKLLPSWGEARTQSVRLTLLRSPGEHVHHYNPGPFLKGCRDSATVLGCCLPVPKELAAVHIPSSSPRFPLTNV